MTLKVKEATRKTFSSSNPIAEVLTVGETILEIATASRETSPSVALEKKEAPKEAPVVLITTPPEEPKQVATISRTTIYEPMAEAASDTDESYVPTISPCKVPLGFKIGSFDTRFGISKEDFIKEVEASAKIWGDEVNKQLFFYSESGALTINLIYDERQARTVDINYLVVEIENAKQNAENLKTIYEKDKADYLLAGEKFTSDSELFKAKYKIYEDRVLDYNQKGGAPKDVYDAMTLELQDLKREATALEERRKALVITMDAINAKVVKYNEFIIYINTLIRKSNAIGAKKFTEGRYVPLTNTIDIYQFSDRIKLRRVVTHELGHVLGINHNDNARSIMYSVNSGTSLYLQAEDIRDLKEVCN